jgi:anti-sigma factor RsiW
MKVAREVILDLLPLYLAGEASPATRALVEDSLREDPELERRVRAGDAALVPDVKVAPRPEAELASLLRTRRTLGRLRWTCALATTCTAISLALRIDFTDGRLTTFRFLIADYPLPFGLCMAAGAALWALYFSMRRRAAGTGLA